MCKCAYTMKSTFETLGGRLVGYNYIAIINALHVQEVIKPLYASY